MLVVDMPNLMEVFPDAKTLLALEPEELGGVLLELIRPTALRSPGHFHMSFLTRSLSQADPDRWPAEAGPEIETAVAEAFGWLERVGLAMKDFGQTTGHLWILTRRGKQLRSRGDVASYRDAGMLPTGLVHSTILEKTESAFLRGDHDIAVFAAFKAIEVAVRTACAFSDGELGVPLMRKAFHPETGPLTDKALVISEREATAALFAGAIGAAKNPTSHREFEMSNVEAARLILFASYLMSIVEARARPLTAQ